MNEWIHLLIFSTNVYEPHTAFQTLECVHGAISKREKTWENMRNFLKQQSVIFQISQVISFYLHDLTLCTSLLLQCYRFVAETANTFLVF